MASRDKVDVDTFQKSIQYALEKLEKSKSGFKRTAVSNFKSKKTRRLRERACWLFQSSVSWCWPKGTWALGTRLWATRLIVISHHRATYLLTLPVFPGVSKFFINLPGDFRGLFLVIVFNDILTMQRFLDLPDFCTLGVGRYGAMPGVHLLIGNAFPFFSQFSEKQSETFQRRLKEVEKLITLHNCKSQ